MKWPRVRLWMEKNETKILCLQEKKQLICLTNDLQRQSLYSSTQSQQVHPDLYWQFSALNWMGSLHNLNSGDISAPLVFLLSQCSVGQVCTIYFRLRLSAQWPECNFFFLNSKACFTGNVFVCFLIVRRQCCYFHPFISL